MIGIQVEEVWPYSLQKQMALLDKQEGGLVITDVRMRIKVFGLFTIILRDIIRLFS